MLQLKVDVQGKGRCARLKIQGWARIGKKVIVVVAVVAVAAAAGTYLTYNFSSSSGGQSIDPRKLQKRQMKYEAKMRKV